MAKENKKERIDTDEMVEIFRRLRAQNGHEYAIPHYRDPEIPFWGDGSDEDIFKAHPDSKKSLIYRP